MSEAPLAECPVCAGTVRRVVNSVGIVFKGSGFYITDNRSGSSANGASSSAAQNKDKSEEKSEPKSEKSETKTKAETKKETADATS
jgi:hypothetical protein